MADMTCAILLAVFTGFVPGQLPTVLPKAPIKFNKLTTVAGKTVSIPAKSAKATVLLFVGTDCPIANRMAPEMSRIIGEYKQKSVDCWMVYPDRELKNAEVNEHMKSFAIECQAFIDRKHALVKASGASVTPQAVILDSAGFVKYLGRINDLYAEHGRTNPAPKVNDLRDALDALLAGKAIKSPITEAIGCYISD